MVGRVRKRMATQRKGKKKLQRNGTVRIQTDRTVSDRIIALQRERTEKDHRMIGRSVGRGTSTLSKRTRMYVKVTLTIQRRSGTCWCFMVSAVWLFVSYLKYGAHNCVLLLCILFVISGDVRTIK